MLPSCGAAIINLLVCSCCCDLSVICRGLRLFLCPLLLSALIEILLCRMFPHPRRKSHLARPESSEISEMLWRTITCLKNAVDVLLAAKWLGSCLSSLNSMLQRLWTCFRWFFFWRTTTFLNNKSQLARHVASHSINQRMGFTNLKILKLAWVQYHSNAEHSLERFAKAVCRQTRLLYSVIKRPFLNHTCPGHQGDWEQSLNII